MILIVYVLVVDVLLPRNQWCVGRITTINVGHDNRVRSVKVKISKCKSGRNLDVSVTEVERPIVKLIKLLPADNK